MRVALTKTEVELRSFIAVGVTGFSIVAGAVEFAMLSIRTLGIVLSVVTVPLHAFADAWEGIKTGDFSKLNVFNNALEIMKEKLKIIATTGGDLFKA